MQKNVNDWERVISVAAGAFLLVRAVRRRQLRSANAWTGAGLIARGTSGFCPVNAAIGRGRRRDDTRRALSGGRGVRLVSSIVVRRPIDDVYEYWRDLRNLPRFMPHVERIDILENNRSHWVVRGPSGVRVEWDAEVINTVPPLLIGWRTLPGADVASAGSVRFVQLSPVETEVHVTLQYDPPAGKIGASMAWLMGEPAGDILRQDLGRLKDLVEHSVAAV